MSCYILLACQMYICESNMCLMYMLASLLINEKLNNCWVTLVYINVMICEIEHWSLKE
jgi:hypothetical protein